MPEIICENKKCGKEKHKSPRAFNRSNHHFCSRACHQEWRWGRSRKKKKQMEKGATGEMKSS